MMVFVLVLVIVVMMMVMMFMLILVIIVVMMVMMAAAIRVVALIVIVVVMVMVVRLFFHFLEFERDGGLLLHGLFDLRPGQLRPRRGNDHGIVILLANQVNAGVELGLGHAIRAGEDDGVGRFDLVVVELAEVLHVHFALRRVRYGDKIAELHFVIRHALHSLDDVRQLADAGRLDQDAVGCVLGHNLLQRLAEVASRCSRSSSR